MGYTASCSLKTCRRRDAIAPKYSCELVRAGRAAWVQGAPCGIPRCWGKGWAGSERVGVWLSQLGQPVGSLPVLEDKASPAASVTLLLFCSSSRACVGRDLSLWREFFWWCLGFLQVLPVPAVLSCLEGMQRGLLCSQQPRDPAENGMENLVEVTSDMSGLGLILLFCGHLFPPFSCEITRVLT